MKRQSITVLLILAFVAAILFFIQHEGNPFLKPKTVRGEEWRDEPQQKPAGDSRKSKPQTPGSLLPRVAMTAVEYKFDPLALSRDRENSPFELRGGAGTGRVTDRKGKVILESSDELGIFGAVVSPGHRWVLVRGGDGKSLLLEPPSDRRIAPPTRPPGSNLFPFEWHWIGPDLLFGISGVEKISHEGPHENCCNDNNVAQTKFYTFDVVRERLSEVVMPGAVTQPVVNAVDFTGDGHIHLKLEEPQDGVEQDLGWFRIGPPE
ncbi:MAG: hypothetical protein EOP87_00605 [Verrucomicrobiaceae bacterium]|nr:MAG: hypothetical protein EOP87_00605 [Verrucomicrobiaceae bacterium]